MIFILTELCDTLRAQFTYYARSTACMGMLISLTKPLRLASYQMKTSDHT